jgi:hypothetical protein
MQALQSDLFRRLELIMLVIADFTDFGASGALHNISVDDDIMQFST